MFRTCDGGTVYREMGKNERLLLRSAPAPRSNTHETLESNRLKSDSDSRYFGRIRVCGDEAGHSVVFPVLWRLRSRVVSPGQDMPVEGDGEGAWAAVLRAKLRLP
jgi:hypothetical protein